MQKLTRQKFNNYLQSLATLNDVVDTSKKFNVAPSVQQTLETRIQEASSMLQQINIQIVSEQQGQKLGLGIGGPVAGTTDTTQTDRQTQDPTSWDQDGYICTQTNFDTHITYAKLDAWSKFPDFETRIRDLITRRQALDRIMIGLNGTQRAASSNRVNFPLLQDVNKGWLQKVRESASQRVLDEGAQAGKVRVGSGGDYVTLDALIYDAVNNMIDPWFREDTGLVVLVGREMMADKYFPLVNAQREPSEQLATDLVISQKRIGGLQGIQVPFMPAGTALITRMDNLSLYVQEGGRRRVIEENAKRDRIENYESSNDAYVVEDYGMACLIENIELVAQA